jgi:hypothetical protein
MPEEPTRLKEDLADACRVKSAGKLRTLRAEKHWGCEKQREWISG